MVRTNPNNVGAKGKEKFTEGLSRKRARSGEGSGRLAVQPNPNEKLKRVRLKWVKDYGRAWYASFKPLGRKSVCLSYMLMIGQQINVGVVMKREMKEARMGQGHWFFFGSTLTHYLRYQGVFEEDADVRMPMPTPWEDITRLRHLNDVQGMTFSTTQRHAMIDSIMMNMYVMKCLHLTLGSIAATPEQMVEIDERFPLSPHALILCKMGQAFEELVDDDVYTLEPDPHVDDASDEETEVAA
ncbi:hypothetical protein K7X08_010529 [Anisodus acutangulus]|uniref:Uncharacterized protein n=1 Tax=Anisodus acutangulus TaxID=402998 RepID=A0A9Q1N505_9SOLA|nr:hypothetical protein K7X08_010529 [Anisodus acutangulus]